MNRARRGEGDCRCVRCHSGRVDEVGVVPSTAHLDRLAEPADLLAACRALSLAEAALNANAATRWHTLERVGEDAWLCRIIDGAGNEAVMSFSPVGAVIRGFDHESLLSPWAREPMHLWPGLDDGLPEPLRRTPTIMIDGIESVTFCIWWARGAAEWSVGTVEPPRGGYADPDGSEYLLRPTSGVEEAHRFLTEYYELDLPEELVSGLFSEAPLGGELLGQLAVRRSVTDVEGEATRLSYPFA